MRAFRVIVLAIVATVALLGGVASTASADQGWIHSPHRLSTASTTDPADPGLPPD